MAQSIVDLQQTFRTLIVLSPTSLSFTLDEGRGFGTPQEVTISNGGTYGSLLDASITSSATFMVVSPALVGGLASSASGQFSVTVDSTNLTAVGGPYSATVTVQDPNAPNSPQTIPVLITIRPKASISVSPTTLSFAVAGALSGTFTPSPVSSQTFTIQNAGPSGSVLNFQVQKLTGLSPWLTTFSPTTGTLNSGSSQAVTVSVQPTPLMSPGTYTETLRVSGYSSNLFQDVQVTLTVSP